MRMIDEDEVGLKEQPEDTRHIKKITSKCDPKDWECVQRIPNFAIFEESVGSGIGDSEMDKIINHWKALGVN